MATVEKISVALPSEMVSLLREAVESGEYSSASEVVRDALRTWKMKRKLDALQLSALRRLVKQGAESGPGIGATTVFSRLRKKYAANSTAKPE
jgi:antitoxin ParD1/3/4